jgi:hypothetical protein
VKQRARASALERKKKTKTEKKTKKTLSPGDQIAGWAQTRSIFRLIYIDNGLAKVGRR